jgi:hypothetical protein
MQILSYTSIVFESLARLYPHVKGVHRRKQIRRYEQFFKT